MINFRSWDKLGNNFIIKLTGKPNPYKEGTFEASLVDFVISIKDNIISDSRYTQLLVDYLIKHQIKANLDPWCLHDYFKKALWLAKFSDVVYTVKAEKDDTLQFGIFLEGAMLNMLKEPSFVKQLEKVKNPERKKALHQVLQIADHFYDVFKLPTYHVDYSKSSITVNNMSEGFFQRIESLPIQTYNFPYQHWVDVETRGYFHHLGDELAFIIAALNHGDCYILGNDEFGDLQVLNIVQSTLRYTKFRVGEKITFRDMDYVYGLPRTTAMYPSSKNNIFNYSEDLANSKLNHQDNANFTGAYWKNKVFQKYAKRPLEELTIKELIFKIKQSFNEIIAQSNQEIQKVYSNIGNYYFLIKEALVLKQDLIQRLYDEVKVNEVQSLKKIKKAQSNMEKFISIQIREALGVKFQDEYDFKFRFLSDIFILFGNRSAMLLMPTEVEAFIDYGFKQLCSLLDKDNQETLGLIKQLNLKLKQLMGLFLLQNNALNEKLRNHLSFFYKTTAHKVHCEIINPKSNKELGFFLKDKTDVRHYLDFSSLVSFLFSQENLSNINNNVDIVADFILNNLSNVDSYDDSYKSLLKYWSALDIKAVVMSPIVDMKNEYRMFVINGKVVAGSPCFRNSTPFDAWNNGRFDARLCHGHSAYETFINRERVAKYAKFARKFTQEMRQEHPEISAYVLDVAWNDDLNEVIAIEVNTVSFSGAYQIDFRRVCCAIAKKPFYYNEVNREYWTNWEKLKLIAQDKIENKNKKQPPDDDILNVYQKIE